MTAERNVDPIRLLRECYFRLLGPRDFPYDELKESPHSFYTVGIIDSVNKHEEYYKGDDETERPGYGEEEEEEEIYVYSQSKIDPRNFPYSCGLSFSCETDDGDVLDFKVFLSYAEYKKERDEKNKEFKYVRIPCVYEFRVRIEEKIFVEGIGFNQISERDYIRFKLNENTEIFIRYHKYDTEIKVFISFINKKPGELEKGERCIYQPHIGIKFLKGTLRTFKGALTSVITRKQLTDLEYINGDINFVAPDLNEYLKKSGFSIKELDLLTTYIPFFFKTAPRHKEGYDFSVNLSNSENVLLETFLQEAKNMLGEYSKWYTGFRDNENLKVIADRIMKGIKLVEEDDCVKKAFIFALKTITKSAEWAEIKNFSLRPFQVAYILTVLESLINENSDYRFYCDILNVPTGAGKTEAYLFLAVFYAAFRRLKYGKKGLGTAVISRYTLRMLTVQQFLRTLKTFAAAEYIRSTDPYFSDLGDEPFSVGLWVGQGITHNRLRGFWIPERFFPGMIDDLLGGKNVSKCGIVSECPACHTPLVIPEDFLREEGEKVIYVPFIPEKGELLKDQNEVEILREIVMQQVKDKIEERMKITVKEIDFLRNDRKFYLFLKLAGTSDSDFASEMDSIWKEIGANLPFRPLLTNPKDTKYLTKYRLMKYSGFRYPGYYIDRDCYRIKCPNPECELTKNGLNIHAYIVDEYLYEHPPTFLIATVDKVAQVPCKGEAFGFFGGNGNYMPPELIIQDEIHLIEGPMGSLYGLYEVQVDYLCDNKAKYISSSATIKNAEVVSNNALGRKVFIFPEVVERRDERDGFFISYPKNLDKNKPYRLYAGICAYGKGSITPQVDAYETILSYFRGNRIKHPIVGYYNEIKELARATGILKQDVRARLRSPVVFTELSSRIKSEKISYVLKNIERNFEQYDVILSTSIFGTGVDIPGLSVMLMRGQPKRTSDYIQATGRVGRKTNSFIFIIYGNTRPRDMSHFEYFVPYHGSIERFIEDPSVFPFSTSIYQRVLPAIAVVVYRKASSEGCDNPVSLVVSEELQKILRIRNNRQLEEFRLPESDIVRLVQSISQRMERCIYDGKREGCLYSAAQEGKFLLTPLPDVNEDIIRRTCFRNIPSSLRNTEGEIKLRIY